SSPVACGQGAGGRGRRPAGGEPGAPEGPLSRDRTNARSALQGRRCRASSGSCRLSAHVRLTPQAARGVAIDLITNEFETGSSSMEKMLALAERSVPRYTSHPTAPHFSADLGPRNYADWLDALP